MNARMARAVGLLIALTLTAPSALLAAVPAVHGIVIDAASGLPITGALVGSAARQTTTDASGHFALDGTVQAALTISAPGYQSARTETSGGGADLVVALTRQTPDSLPVVARTTIHATESLERSQTISKAITGDHLLANAQYRAADAIRTLTGVNQTEGESASFGDDLHFDIRGIGGLETVTLIDGHPAGLGLSKNYNFEISPSFGLQRVLVSYGSGGADLTGTNAIGGVIDLRTLEPTIDPRSTFLLGAGTFDRSVTAFRATGTSGRFGYAVALGVSGMDGPFRNQRQYASGAAFDQSATDPAVHNLGVYAYDSAITNKSGLFKTTYDLSAASRLTASALFSSYYDDKTGNGDIDYLTTDAALARGAANLSGKSSSDPCPGGTFTATNANGAKNGFGPTGAPDGGITCQTPQQYAAFNTGWQGIGPSWQAFQNEDYHLRYEANGAHDRIVVDTFSDRYAHTTDRTDRLPFNVVPGDRPSFTNEAVTATGFTVSGEDYLTLHDLGAGYTYANSAFAFRTNGSPTPSPITDDAAFFLRDVYHPNAKLTAYGNAWFKWSSITHTAFTDPRLALTYRLDNNDVLRIAGGRTSSQPYASYLTQGFTPSASLGFNGTLTCSGLNSIGTAPSSTLRPERATDEEVSLGHRFAGDSQIQVTAYSENVLDKIYKSIAPISQTGVGFVDPVSLAGFRSQVASACGASNVDALLGVSGYVNIARVQAQGIDVAGRQRLTRRIALDYDWAVQSSILRAAPVQLLQTQLDLIPNAQLPLEPLHKANLALDYVPSRGWDVELAQHFIASNNAKNLPNYSYGTLRLSAPLHHDVLAIIIDNVFNQNADIRGLLGAGVPLALNSYAKSADYAPFIGTAATERFSLPYRTITVTYQLRR